MQPGFFAFIEPHCRSPPPSFRFQQTQNRKDGKTMKTINLKDYYPYYTQDSFVEVPDELFAIFEEYARAEATYERKKYRYKAHYSLDRGDGIEHDILFVSLSPDEIYERKLTSQQLHAAIASLPDKQAKRIYAHYFMGMSKTAIAKAEGVSEKAVRIGIERGLHTIEKYLKSFF
jgi:RNA polymerase sigma-70 factor, ECF subfamily